MDEKWIVLKAIKEAEELNKKFLSLEIDSKGLQRSKVGSNTAEKNNLMTKSKKCEDCYVEFTRNLKSILKRIRESKNLNVT